MPKYTIKFPDGHVQQFSGPDMKDEDVWTRAVQERAIDEGRIPTTWWGGAAKALGEDPQTTRALISGVGYATGQPEIVAAAPLAARGIQYATQRATGQNPATPAPQELGLLAAEGAITGYGPGVAAKGARTLAEKTVAHQLPNGQWVAGVKGAGVMPWAVRTAGELSGGIADKVEMVTPQAVGQTVRELLPVAATAAAIGLSNSGENNPGGNPVEDLKLLDAAVARGAGPATAAREIAQGDAKRFSTLMTLYMRSRLRR